MRVSVVALLPPAGPSFWPLDSAVVGGSVGEGGEGGGSCGEAWFRSRCVWDSVVMKTGSAAQWESAVGATPGERRRGDE